MLVINVGSRDRYPFHSRNDTMNFNLKHSSGIKPSLSLHLHQTFHLSKPQPCMSLEQSTMNPRINADPEICGELS